MIATRGAAAAVIALLAGAAPVLAARVDGISDQSLPAWDAPGGPAAFSQMVASRLIDGPDGQLRFARYVVQWDAMDEASAGANAAGDYRERYEAWLGAVGALGLVPLLAPTSYTTAAPPDPSAYVPRLQALLARAAALGTPIAYVEPWNEPNGQGRAAPALAARLAGAASALCATYSCRVIAGGFQDTPDAAAYAREYAAALTFTPPAWGVHPYVSVARREAAPLAAVEAALPAATTLWVTEVAGQYCRRGRVLGQASQAADVGYLLHQLPAQLPLAPAHILYYGLRYAGGTAAPCGPGGGEDGELFSPDGLPRAAALIAFAGLGEAPLFGPAPGADALAG